MGDYDLMTAIACGNTVKVSYSLYYSIVLYV